MDDVLLFTAGITLIQVGLALGLALVLERRTPRIVRWVVAHGDRPTDHANLPLTACCFTW